MFLMILDQIWIRSAGEPSFEGGELKLMALRNLYVYVAGIFKKSMGARHRVGIGLSYRPARLHRLAKLMPLNRFQGSINV